MTLDKRMPATASPSPSASPAAPAFRLGEQQQALIERTMTAVAEGGTADVLFPGAAGTGKTTTVKALIQRLRDEGYSFAVAAPTHKAAGRCQESLDGLDVEVTTHHRLWCSSAEEIIEEGEEFADDLSLGVADDRTLDADVLIIDESSMISGQDYSNIRTVFDGVIVAVGDHHQLPPVGGAPGFDWSDADSYGLTKVYRQAGGSPVLAAATAIREQRAPFTWSKVADWKRGTDILRAAKVPSRWLNAGDTGTILADMIRDNNGSAAAVVGTHVSRVLVNDACRYALGLPNRRLGPAVGERLVARASAGGLANATSCTVEEVEDADFGHRFGKGWICAVTTEAGRKKVIAVLEQQWIQTDSPANRGKIPYSIGKMMRTYTVAEQAEYGYEINEIVAPKVEAYVAEHANDENPPKDAPSWLRKIWVAKAAHKVGAWALFLDQHLAAVDSGYAVTCHAAQGSQWADIIVVADWVDFLAEDPKTGKIVAENVYRWSYTALTRAENNALVVCKSKGGWVKPQADKTIEIGTASLDWQARKRGW